MSALSAAVWNGVAFQPMGAGLTGQTLEGTAVTLADGTIIMGGSFTASNAVFFPIRWRAGMARRSSHSTPICRPTSVIMYWRWRRRLMAGWRSATITPAAQPQPASRRSRTPAPRDPIQPSESTGHQSGTAQIYQLVNITTNRAIYLNLTLSVGEVATLIFTPDNLSFTTTFQGNLEAVCCPDQTSQTSFSIPARTRSASSAPAAR